MVETILQHPILTRFAFPFLLVFFVLFALLEKTKVLGDKKQINALISFVVSLIFVNVAFPVEVVSNMVLFLTVAMVTTFVGLILWGFIGGKAQIENKSIKMFAGLIIVIAIIVAILWATGFYPFVEWLFKQEWSKSFWTNLIFIVVLVVAVALVLKGGAGKGED